MDKKKLAQKVRRYDLLERANDCSLRALMQLPVALEQKNAEEVMRRYSALVRGIYCMGANYRDLGQAGNYLRFCSRFDEREREIGQRLEKGLAELVLSGRTSFDAYREMTILNYNESYGYGKFSECYSHHDFIRCLHASGFDALFSCPDIQEGFETKSHPGGEFKILNLGKGNKAFLDAMQAIYKEGVTKHGYSEEYKIISMDGRISSRIYLGDHMSYLDAWIKGRMASVNVRFVNTPESTYSNAPYRGEYVCKVLEMLGFRDLEESGIFVTGRRTNIPVRKLPRVLKDVTRMFVSTTDLDMDEVDISGRVDEAVSAFMSGTTNIYNILRKKG
jgi:hypothetical protein